MSFCGLTSFPTDLNQVSAQCGSDAGEVEPFCTLENGIPVEIGRRSHLNGGVCTVIDADRAALRSALLVEVDTHTFATTDDLGGVYTVTAQRVDSGLTDGVGGQLGNKSSIHTIVCQGDGNVCFAATESEFHMVTLNKALVVIRLQTQHQFAKSNDFCHDILILSS